MDLHLTGHCAIVTGATGGIGRAVTTALCSEGANVLGVGRDPTALRELAAHASGRVHSVRCDMRDREAVATLPATAVERFGRLDIVVNNAGVNASAPLEEQSDSTWDLHVAVNLMAAVVLTRAAAPVLLARRSGKVINMVS